jgi:hypothetical protein
VSKILGAMKLKIHEIILKEQRPFSLSDLKTFEIGGKRYKINYGTLRNNISALVKAGFVEPAFRSRPAFYTIPGKKFDKSMTLDHTGVPNEIINKYILKQTPVYKWIKNRPFEKQALHNIRLVFESTGIWNIFSIVYPDKIGDVNKDIELQTLIFFDHITVIITIHHNNTVSIAVSCSDKPVATDVKGIIHLFEVLTRTEVHITDIIDNYYYSTKSIGPLVTIPHYGSWVVKMWHFGVDSIDEYDGRVSCNI